MDRIYDLGPVPRPAVVQLVYADGTQSAWYLLESSTAEPPDGVVGMVIRQLPVYPRDYPAGNDPGWGNKDGAAFQPPGEAAGGRAEVRGRERFQPVIQELRNVRNILNGAADALCVMFDQHIPFTS